MKFLGIQRQMKITDYAQDKVIQYYYIPNHNTYKDNRGLAERQIKKRLEKQHWEVWRGSLIGLTRSGKEMFPSVRRKYTRLVHLLHYCHPEHLEILQYISSVQKGIPDFICYRYGVFKFVECKFKHEQLSLRQKKCIRRLQSLGFTVEVMKFVDPSTRLRVLHVNHHTQERRVLSRQKALRVY
jgi:hypothetical protein